MCVRERERFKISTGSGSNTMKGDVFDVSQPLLGLDNCFYIC